MNNTAYSHSKAFYVAHSAIIAAVYVVLTLLVNVFGLASGAIQVRISEALCILPVFTPAAIPGLFIGCLIANLVTGAAIYDIIFGSLATLIGAVGTWLLRRTGFAFTLPPVISNMIIIPLVLKFAYGLSDAFWFLVVTVGIGEIISVCILGFILKKALWKFKAQLF